MWALQFSEYGGPEVLRVGEAAEPHAGPGQIRIAVRAASVNPWDWKLRSGMRAEGKSPEQPILLGLDAAGVVDEVGEGVIGVSVGDEVFGRGSNTQAEFAVLDAWAPKHPSVDWVVAAAAGTAAETSERTLRVLGVQPGETLFIDGAAGGVGAAATQFAVARGIKVVASASEDNQGYLREIGATPVVYGPGMVERVRALPGVHIDAVLDVAGKTPAEDLLALTPDPSKVLTIANYAAASSGALRFTGGGADSRPMEALAEAAELLKEGKLVIKVQTFPFSRAAEAHALSQDGHVRGKLVLIPEH
jgi:NADPH:quinone reductase-like Zn-dependent oxidoreductase